MSVFFIRQVCESQADKYQNLVNQENRMPAENKYIFIVNQRHSNALNEMLADIREMRLTKDFDNSVFEKEMDENLVPELKMEDMELTVESMEEGIEYGNRMIAEFPHADTCRHIITKEEFVEHYEDMCSQEVLVQHFKMKIMSWLSIIKVLVSVWKKSWEQTGIRLLNMGQMVAKRYKISKWRCTNSRYRTKEEMKISRKYEGYDYIARKQEDGNYEIHVSEHQTKMIDREMKLKTNKPTKT